MSIEKKWLNIETDDNHKLSLFVIKPKGKIKGNLIIIQEIFGVNSHIQQVCEQYAKEGYAIASPALFDRVQKNVQFNDYSSSDMENGFALKNQLKWEQIFLDLEATYKYIFKKTKLKTAIIGYCFGGTVAWRAATQLNKLNAAVCYYGGQIAEFANEKPHCPVLLHFGIKDHYITSEDRAKIRSLQDSEVTINEYDADHGFNCDVRASFNADAAQLAFQTTLKFISNHLH